MTDRSGVEIDYCPQCRGVWLDRGELDKIIERAAPDVAPTSAPPPRRDSYRGDDHRREHDWDDGKGYGRKKRKGLLGEIFDF